MDNKKLISITKHGLMSKLYERDLYTTKDVEYIISKRIIEYDIKSANVNLCRYYNLLPEEELEKIEAMDKHNRVVYIGKLQKDKTFANKLSKAFENIRKQFFIANGINDSDILSIKKDAIFIVGKRCRNTNFGNITFVEKNVYSSYHKLNGLEFYYSGGEDRLDVKGIDDKSLYLYQKFINILKRLFRYLERGQKEEFVRFIKDFTKNYKDKKLSYEYYKEFKPKGTYTLIQDDANKNMVFSLDSIDASIDEKLCINYNYMAYILPIIQRHYFNF